MIKAWKSNSDLLYKFTDHENRSWVGDCLWTPRQWVSAKCDAPIRLRSGTCIHAFNNPYVAVIMQPHYFPRTHRVMWRAQGAGERITAEPTKSGYRMMRLLYPIEAPKISYKQRRLFYSHAFCARARAILELPETACLYSSGFRFYGSQLQEEIRQLKIALFAIENRLEHGDVPWWDDSTIVSDSNTYRHFFSLLRIGRRACAVYMEMATLLPPLAEVIYSENGPAEYPETLSANRRYINISEIADKVLGKFEEQRQILGPQHVDVRQS